MAENFYKFPAMNTIETAWEKVRGVKGSIWAVLGLNFINIVFFGLISTLFQSIFNKNAAMIPTVIGGMVQLILSWGLIYIGIKRAADQPVFYKLFKLMFSWDLYFKMIGLYILQAVIAGLTVIIIIPALLITSDALWAQIATMIIFAVWYVVLISVLLRMFLGKAIVVDQRLNPWAAIKLSFKATKGNVWRILGFLIVCILILLISLVPVGIGLIWSIPLLLVAYGLAYKRLMEKSAG